MSLLGDHLWRQVFGCTAKSAGQVVFWQRFGKTVIDNPEVARLINENVLKLEISVHDTLLVKISDGHTNLKGIELNHWLRKALVCLENFVKFSTFYERHYEVKPSLGLEKILHTT